MSGPREYLKARAQTAEAYLDKTDEPRARAKDELQAIRALFNLLDAHNGSILPDDVREAEDGLGMHIGAMLIAPPKNAGAADLHRYINLMRVIVEVANHQAVVGVKVSDARVPDAAHVRQQATLTTMQMPVGEPEVAIQQGLCKHCNAEIYRSGSGMSWLHFGSQEVSCGEGKVAEPLEAVCACTEESGAAWWCPVEGHRPAYPIQPAVPIPGAQPEDGGQ